MTTRRGFLASLMAAATLPSLTWADAGSPAFLAAAAEPEGGYALFGLTPEGAETFRIPLPARGHAGAGHPHRAEAVAFARRPGTYVLVIDCVRGTVSTTLHAPKGSHFSGHGTFSATGDTLYTCEVDDVTGDGRIGVWYTDRGYARAGAFASGGIGPHEMLRLPGRDILVVANGGILAALDDDRTKLNLDTMRPNLTYLTGRGTPLDRMDLPRDLHRNSIRHLAVTADGTVAFAMQWEGDESVNAPLLGLHRLGQTPILCDVPEPLAPRLKGYAGSVAFAGDDRSVAITCPKGGLVVTFDDHGDYIDMLARPDVCGIGRAADGFVATDGLGGVIALSGDAPRPLGHFSRYWDNHLVAL